MDPCCPVQAYPRLRLMERDRRDATGPNLRWAILAFGLSAFFLIWIVFPHRFVPSDPWSYSHLAHDLATNGGIVRNHVFDHRLGVIVPVGVIYSIFGVSIWSTNLWPLCAGLIILATVWMALPDNRSRLLGIVLCVTCVPLIKGVTALYPDIVATAFMALSSAMLFARRRPTVSSRWLGRSRLAPLQACSSPFWQN